MSTRTAIRPHVVIGSTDFPGDMSGNITSEVTILQSVSICSYSFSWTGTSPVGTLSIQGSNNYQVGADGKSVINAGTWSPLPLSLSGSTVTAIPVSGNADSGVIDIDISGLYAIRAVYTFGSGVGTMNAVIAGKVA